MRKIPNNGNLKMAYPLGLFVCLFIYVAYIKWHWTSATQAFFSITEVAAGARRGQQAHSPTGTAGHGHEVFYGIMFDAGSTGTRIHIFQFAQQPRETPTLTHETFRALKPGLSAYADDVEKVIQMKMTRLDSVLMQSLLRYKREKRAETHRSLIPPRKQCREQSASFGPEVPAQRSSQTKGRLMTWTFLQSQQQKYSPGADTLNLDL